MFLINMFFVFSISLSIFNINSLYITISFIPIFIVFVELFTSDLITTGLLPFMFLVFIARMMNTNTMWMAIRYLIYSTIMILYQQLSFFIKFNIIAIDYVDYDLISTLIYSIDLYLVYIISYMAVRHYVKVKKNKYVSKNKSTIGTPGTDNIVCIKDAEKLVVYPEDKSIQEIEGRHSQTVTEELKLNELGRGKEILFWIIAMGFQVVQLLVVLGIGLLNNAFLELIAILIVFWSGRSILKISWHSDSLSGCSAVTFGAFYILSKITLPFKISLFLCVMLSTVFTYIMYLLGLRAQEKELEKEKISK